MKQRINVTNSKLYAHAYRCTNSTTANFSYVQPLMCRMLMANSKIKGNLNIFARLAAMPRPTFGKINLETHISFVPIEQIYPSFMSLMSELPYTNSKGTSIKPTKLPSCLISDLYKALTYAVGSYDVCYTSLYKVQRGVAAPASVSALSFDEYNAAYGDSIEAGETPSISKDFFSRPLYNPIAQKAVADYRSKVLSKEDAEKLYSRSFPSATDISASNLDLINGRFDFIEVTSVPAQNTETLTCIVLTDRGKALRKLFLGLGYNVSNDDDTSVSILPLLAYYKAYYDFAIPFRDAPFESTKCYSLIRWIDEHGDFNFYYQNAGEGGSEGDELFSSFIRDELSQCFSVQDINWLSLHTNEIINNRSHFVSEPLRDSSPVPLVHTQYNVLSHDGSVPTPSSSDVASMSNEDESTFNALSVKLLLKMYGYYGRDSIIGNRINLWAKAHLNSDVYNSLFASCNSINHASSMIQIGDIDATAGTRQDDGTGNVLGDYAGKGIGSQSVKYKYKTDVYGFFIVFQWINPVTSYYQGTDSQLVALTKYELPQAEFDALGFELTPRSCVWTDNGISLRDAKNPDSIISDKAQPSTIGNDDAFGYVPRYSGFKNAKNIVNGDFSLRSLRNSMSCFYLDREFDVRHLEFLRSLDGKNTTYLGVQSTWLPYASEQWRYIQRYPWLGNYNRIFVNSDNFKFDPFIANVATDLLGKYPWPMDDNFMLHCVFDFTEDTPLKPLSQSFETQVKQNDSVTAVTPA